MKFKIRTYSTLDENTGPLEELSISETMTPEQCADDAQVLLAWMNGNLPFQTWDAFWDLVQVEGDHERSVSRIAGSIWDKMWEEQNPVENNENNQEAQV